MQVGDVDLLKGRGAVGIDQFDPCDRAGNGYKGRPGKIAGGIQSNAAGNLFAVGNRGDNIGGTAGSDGYQGCHTKGVISPDGDFIAECALVNIIQTEQDVVDSVQRGAARDLSEGKGGGRIDAAAGAVQLHHRLGGKGLARCDIAGIAGFNRCGAAGQGFDHPDGDVDAPGILGKATGQVGLVRTLRGPRHDLRAERRGADTGGNGIGTITTADDIIAGQPGYGVGRSGACQRVVARVTRNNRHESPCSPCPGMHTPGTLGAVWQGNAGIVGPN